MANDQKRRRKYLTPVVWFALILLVLVSSSAIFVEKIEGNKPNVVQAAVTGTAKATVTAKATSPGTATSTPTATGTSTGTATATPSVTPSVSPTPTTLFSDNFLNNNQKWAITSSPDYTRMMENNQLVLSVTDHRILIENVPSSVSFSNFTLSMSYTLQKADENDSVGLFLRGDTNLDHDYRIDIFGNNTITVNEEYLSQNEMPESVELLKLENVAALQSVGHMNTLTVEMNGPTMSLNINGTQIFSSLYNSDYTQGQIALFVNNGATSDGAIASFSNIEVNSIPNPLPFPSPTSTTTPTGN
jgi:hypothetical protein